MKMRNICCLFALLVVVGGMFFETSLHAQEKSATALEGLIAPSEVVNLSSPVVGVIETINVERGDLVRKGQVLATLKCGVEMAAVQLARAQVAFGKRKALRNEELFKKKLISVDDRDAQETEIELAQLQLQEAEERLALRTLKSPVNGVVMERMLAPGEYIGEGALLRLARLDPLYVEVIVPIKMLGTIRNGRKAVVIPEEPVGGKYNARVCVVDRVVDAASGTYGVRLRLPNPGNKIPSGLKCRIEF
jgi:RND family efflux transporter MFP subunit